MWLNKDKWLNELLCGDNIEVLKKIADESVDLIYIDPPFFSNRHYEVIWGNGAELRSFGDRWKGGIEHYIGWMVERLKELHRILKPTGSIYVHLDWHAVHYVKVEMDKIFGLKNFKNEIAWCYKEREISKSRWNTKHDTILFYTKGEEYTFNWAKLTTKYSEGSLKKYSLTDEKGRKYQIRGKGGKYIGKQGLSPAIEKAHPSWTYRDYLDLKPGVLARDWWDDIPFLNRAAKERIGYPTQKPEALLERIVTASSNEGDVILDAFCGCGTTLAVSEKLNRKWICMDVSPVAVNVMTERLEKLEKKLGKKSADFITLGLPDQTIPQLRLLNGQDFQDFIIEQIDGKPAVRKVHDFGIDGYTADGIPVQVKNSEKVGRNVVDNFQAAIRRVDSKKGKIYAVTFGRGATEEAARLKNEDGINIELIELKPFLVGKYGDHTRHQ